MLRAKVTGKKKNREPYFLIHPLVDANGNIRISRHVLLAIHPNRRPELNILFHVWIKLYPEGYW